MIMNTRQAIYIAILAAHYFSSANKRVITWSRKHFSYRTKIGTLIFLDKSRLGLEVANQNTGFATAC